jgi:hypothetical protein
VLLLAGGGGSSGFGGSGGSFQSIQVRAGRHIDVLQQDKQGQMFLTSSH